ncbi:MAG TPA: TonB family protein [Nitrospiraceae bacterium]|jgi:TonB family protein|nr:TonB family protein [Nitrospiraceae bacterium]
MVTHTLPRLLLLTLDADQREALGVRFKWTVIASLMLHVCVLLAISGVRLMQHSERPLASVQVSLVTMSPPVRSTETPAARQADVMKPHKVVQPAVPPPVKPAPLPPIAVAKPVASTPIAPPVRSDAPGARRSSGDVMRDVLKGIELPPDAPKFGELSPAKPVTLSQRVDVPRTDRTPEKISSEIDTLLGKLKVPDVTPMTPVVPREPVKTTQAQPRQPSLAEQFDQELEDELKKLQPMPRSVKPVEPPQEAKPVPEPSIKQVPGAVAKVPTVRSPETSMRVSSTGPGSNRYLARVQQKISSLWTAPPVDVPEKALTVVVKFRLHRSGSVSNVIIEQSSGNDYYDLAGKRAVLSANPLPAFPPEMTDSYLDAHFSFTVGEQVG